MVVSIFIVSSVFTLQVVASNYQTTSSNQCSTASVTFNIQGESLDRYNVTTFAVVPSACVAVAFRNVDTIDQSFTIDAISASNVAFFTIYDRPNQVQTVNFLVPNANMTIKYYCAVPGHEANGMYGNLTVGTGSSSIQSSTTRPVSTTPTTTSNNALSQSAQTITTSPSFETVSVILAFTVSVLIASKFKRTRK